MSIDQAISDGVTLLRSLRAAPLAEVRSAVQALSARHAPLELHLVPERNEYSGELDYGLLVRERGRESAYVTCRAPSATPWLLHQVHDFREGLLVSVDGEALSVNAAVASLDETLAQASWRERMVNTCIIQRHLKQRDWPVSDEELQQAMDAFRQRRGLLSAAATQEWMRVHGMSHARLETVAAAEVRLGKLRREVCGPRVEPFFRERRAELKRAMLVRLRFSDATLAGRARECAGSRDGFYALAHELLAESLRSGSGASRLDTVVVTPAELEPAFAEAVFAAADAVVGPQRTEAGAYLAYVASIEEPRDLDEPTRALIEQRLFAEWLHDQRSGASIEWNWGREEEPPARSSPPNVVDR